MTPTESIAALNSAYRASLDVPPADYRALIDTFDDDGACYTALAWLREKQRNLEDLFSTKKSVPVACGDEYLYPAVIKFVAPVEFVDWVVESPAMDYIPEETQLDLVRRLDSVGRISNVRYNTSIDAVRTAAAARIEELESP